MKIKNNQKLIDLYTRTFGKGIKLTKKSAVKKFKMKHYPANSGRKPHPGVQKKDKIKLPDDPKEWAVWQHNCEASFIKELFENKDKRFIRKCIIVLYTHGYDYSLEYKPIYDFYKQALKNNDLKIVKMLIDDAARVYGWEHVFDTALAHSKKNNLTKFTDYLNKKRKYHSDGIPDKIRQIENELFDKYKDFIDSCISLRSKIQALAELIDDKKEKKQRLIYLQKLDEVLNNFNAP